MDDRVRDFTKDMLNDVFEKAIDLAAQKIFNAFKSGSLFPEMDGAGPSFPHGGVVDSLYVPEKHFVLSNESIIPKSAYDQLMSAGVSDDDLKEELSKEDIGFIRTVVANKALGGDMVDLESKKCDCSEPCVGRTCRDKKEPVELSDLEKLIATETVSCSGCGTVIKSKGEMVCYEHEWYEVMRGNPLGIGSLSVTECSACATIGGVTKDTNSLGDDSVINPASTKETAKTLIDKYLGERIIDRSMMGAGEITILGVKKISGVVCLIGEDLNCGSYVIDPSGADVSIIPGDE